MFNSLRLPCVIAMTVASCFGAAIATAQPADSLAGIWIGRVDLDSHPAFLQVTVRATTGQPWTADVVLQPIEAISANTVEARRIADSWRNASVVSDGTAWSVTAGIGSNAIQIVAGNREVANTAAVTFKDRRAQIVFRHLAVVEKSREQRYLGVYVLRSGQRIYISRSSNGGALNYLEETTGRSGTLYPVASDSYIAGATAVLPDPVHARATFRDGSDGAPELIWQQAGSEEFIAKQSSSYRREDVQLAGPAGRLGCDLLMPIAGRKRAATVLVPGAGANDRYAVYLIAQMFAEHGVAALTCDKRGTGTSEGDWRLTSFEQQAQDVAAGARFLQQQTAIDSQRVGVWGFSEGAWVAPLVVAQNPALSFLIVVAVPATSRRESLLIANHERLQQAGASAEEIARNRRFFVAYQQAIIDKDASAIDRLWRQYSGASWLPNNMPTVRTLDDWSWERARLTWPYEPGPMLSKIKRPVLAIWGAEDNEFIPSVHVPIFEKAMRAADNSNYTVQVLSGADHSLRLVAPTFVEVTGYAPSYFEAMLEWLRGRASTQN